MKMPAKKKGGSKMARMSEEEKQRYLAHRAEIELEAKRRKQQLIAVFTKNKLKREEAFARLNTAKINEQWRFILRQVKCKELHDDLEYLWANFDRTLSLKNQIIKKLYSELDKADADHRRLQNAHMEMMDKLIVQHLERLEAVRRDYSTNVEHVEIDEMNLVKHEMLANCKHLETVIFAQCIYIEEKLTETRTRNAVNAFSVEHSKEQSVDYLNRSIGGKIDEFRAELNRIMTEYQSKTAEKWKQYEILKSAEDIHQHESSQFPRIQGHLLSTVQSLKDQQEKLSSERSHTAAQLKKQLDALNSRIWKLRQEIRMNQTFDEVQLKKLTVLSGSSIKEMKKISEKSSTILLLMKICSSLEPRTLPPRQIGFVENSEENHGAMAPYDKLEYFWDQYNYVKSEIINEKREGNVLMSENKRLKNSLRSYLMTVAKMPASRPQTCA